MTERFARLLKERIGLDMESVGQVVVERAVQQRAKTRHCASLDAYWTLLSGSPEEQQALVESVVVGETWFFRYPESFAALKQLAFQKLGALSGGRTLRILSLPCSSGEEPYSIVMSLLDAGLAPQLFQVDALDVSQQALDLAQRALYGRNSFRGANLEFRERYFLPQANGYSLSDSVRARVRLLCGNLLDPALLAGEPAYDFVFCRNLLIYFDRATQVRVFDVLKRLMAANGALFIGPAEASLFSQAGLQPLGISQAFVFRRPDPEQTVPVTRPNRAPVASPSAALRVPPPVVRPVRRPLPPLAVVPVAPAEANPSLAALQVLANQGRNAEAAALAQRLLAEQGPTAEVFYWQALLHEVAGELDAAQALYRKVLYLDPQHQEALAHLGTLLAARGDLVGAQRLQQRASRGVKPHER